MAFVMKTLQLIRALQIPIGRDDDRRGAWVGAPGLGLLVPTQRHADVAGKVISELPHLAGNLFHDSHTAILMREHGIGRICTRDADFNRFPFLEVIDPVQTQGST